MKRRKPLKRSKIKKTLKPISILKKRLDYVSRELVKIRDNHTCQRCGKKVWGTNCHASHVIPCSAGNKLRWDLMNMKVLCWYDHFHFWHLNPTDSGEWFKNKFPDRWAYLEANKGMVQMKHLDFQELLDKLEAELKIKQNE